jgi:ABC-2 type transport system permease protein
MMFGCAYYPFQYLQVIGPVRWLFLLNPLVFMSEAMRLAVTPDVRHMALPLLLGGMLAHLLFFGWMGARSFEKRTIL